VLYAMLTKQSTFDSTYAWVGGPGCEPEKPGEQRQPSLYQHPALGGWGWM
jgi:hypothetical protein